MNSKEKTLQGINRFPFLYNAAGNISLKKRYWQALPVLFRFPPPWHPHVHKASLNWTAQRRGCPTLLVQSQLEEGMGQDLRRHSIFFAVLWATICKQHIRVCCPSAGFVAILYTTPHTSTLISYKCKGTERQISPPSFAFTKRSPRKCEFFPVNRDIRS